MGCENKDPQKNMSLVDETWELIDPNPDIYMLFKQFDKEYFWNSLGSVELKWSPRMTLCAGLCRYKGRTGGCSIHLSKPLMVLRARKDLVETLLVIDLLKTLPSKWNGMYTVYITAKTF